MRLGVAAVRGGSRTKSRMALGEDNRRWRITCIELGGCTFGPTQIASLRLLSRLRGAPSTLPKGFQCRPCPHARRLPCPHARSYLKGSLRASKRLPKGLPKVSSACQKAYLKASKRLPPVSTRLSTGLQTAYLKAYLMPPVCPLAYLKASSVVLRPSCGGRGAGPISLHIRERKPGAGEIC